MIEIVIERWKQRDGQVDFLWSIWRDGKRQTMGQAFETAEAAEAAALEVCRQALRCAPDRVTRL
jgi:hypothetical protein